MIILDCEQGTQEWSEARLGIPTASEFSRIVTPTGKLSAARDGYLAELLAEWALGQPVSEFMGTDWTERGHMLEDAAREYYGVIRDVEPRTVGFLYRDDSRTCGASPDSLVGSNGLLETKCPSAPEHLLYLCRDAVPKKYWPQVQGQLWVSGYAWCDFMSYFPELPPVLIRVLPDDRYQDALDQHMPTFIDEMFDGRRRLQAMGIKADVDIMAGAVVPDAQVGVSVSAAGTSPAGQPPTNYNEAAQAAFARER